MEGEVAEGMGAGEGDDEDDRGREQLAHATSMTRTSGYVADFVDL
jgi:hypothetical protein